MDHGRRGMKLRVLVEPAAVELFELLDPLRECRTRKSFPDLRLSAVLKRPTQKLADTSVDGNGAQDGGSVG